MRPKRFSDSLAPRDFPPRRLKSPERRQSASAPNQTSTALNFPREKPLSFPLESLHSSTEQPEMTFDPSFSPSAQHRNGAPLNQNYPARSSVRENTVPPRREIQAPGALASPQKQAKIRIPSAHDPSRLSYRRSFPALDENHSAASDFHLIHGRDQTQPILPSVRKDDHRADSVTVYDEKDRQESQMRALPYEDEESRESSVLSSRDQSGLSGLPGFDSHTSFSSHSDSIQTRSSFPPPALDRNITDSELCGMLDDGDPQDNQRSVAHEILDDEDRGVQFRSSTRLPQVSIPHIDNKRGSQSTLQGRFSIPPSSLNTIRRSVTPAIYNGQKQRDSGIANPQNITIQVAEEPYLHASNDQGPRSDANSVDLGRSLSHQEQFIDDHGGREPQNLPISEAGLSSRAFSFVHAPQDFQTDSPLSIEPPISASPRVSFLNPGDSPVYGSRSSLSKHKGSYNRFALEDETITSSHLSSQGAENPLSIDSPFLRVPSDLQPEDEAAQYTLDAARIDYNRSPSHQNQFIDSHGGRASQNLPMDEAALSSRASCVVYAPQSFQKVSSLGIEPPVSASPRVTFLLPEDNAVNGSKSLLPNQECSQNPYAYEDQMVTLPYLSDQGVKQPFVVRDPFLVPAVLEPVAETMQDPHEGASGMDLNQQIITPYPNFSQASMPSRLSFSKQIEKRSSLRASLVPQESEADNSPETENEDDSTSDSSSDVVPEGRLTLESVARPSFSAMLNEQQSIVRPWDIERLKETESRVNNRNDGASNRSFNNPLVTPNEIGSINYENFDTDSSSLETGMVQDDSRDLPEGLETPHFDSIHGMESDSSELNAQQYEEKTRDSGSLSANASRKSMVQEFIYPNSYPRTSFRVSVSSRDNKEESFPQGAGDQSISSMSCVKQSLEGTSEKDLTSLQTQDFMYSPSLTQNAMDFVPDEKTPIMVENNDPEILEGEFENEQSLYSLQQYEQPEFQEDINEDPNDESIIHHHDSLQQQPSTLIAGTPGDNEMNDKEYLDDALETAQIDDSGDFPYKDNDGYLEDQTYPQPKDGLHAESFADLKHSFRSLEQGFRRSASFVKFPSGTTDLSYEGFAKIHFIEPTTGIWPLLSKSVDMHDLIRFSKDLISQPLLQRLTASPHKQCAITTFTHLLAYMGDVSTEQDLEYHIQQVLMLGIQFPDLHDEIFCQICKQTKDNPSRWSNSRGWQAMALCVGTFAPSSTFCPSLEAHLKQVAGNFVGRFDGDFIIDQDDPLPNPSKAAEYCLARLQKLLQTGSRCLPPLHAEINAVEVLDVDPMVTAEEVTAQLVEMTGLSDPEYYGIFEVLCGDVTIEKTLTKNAYIMDIMSEWNKATIPPLEKDLRLIARAKILFERHLLCLPNSGIELYEHEMEEEDPFNMEIDPSKKEMLFKRRIFIEDISSHSPDVQNAVQNFDYVQAVRDVAHGIYPVEERDALMLGSLQLRADSSFFENVEEALTDEVVRKFGPKIYVVGSEREWKTALMRTAAALPPEEDMSTCINDYIDFLRSRCTLYGSCWYYVKQKADPRLPHEMYLAINTAGVYFVQVKTKEQILHMQFTEICSWGYSNVSFSLVTGNMTYNHDHRLITRQGEDIGLILQKYINQLLH